MHEHGVVLVSARGPVPTLTGHIAGEPIRGSWWGHPEVAEAAGLLDPAAALAALGPTFVTNPKTRKGREKC